MDTVNTVCDREKSTTKYPYTPFKNLEDCESQVVKPNEKLANSVQIPHYNNSEHKYVANSTILLPSNVLANTKLEKFPAVTNCATCNILVQTNVEKSISGGGWAWALLCCCFGSPLFSIFIMFIDFFNEWIHRCPKCNELIAKYKPILSAGAITLIVFAVLITLAMYIFLGIAMWYVYDQFIQLNYD